MQRAAEVKLKFVMCVGICLLSCTRDDDAAQSQSRGEMDSELILKDEDGRELSRADLANVSGPVGYEIEGDWSIPAKANRLHEQGRSLGREGAYDEAIELFAECPVNIERRVTHTLSPA